MAIHESAAKGFAAGADAYEHERPEYSEEAIAKLVEELAIGPGTRVLDLAAVTGKLTRATPSGPEWVTPAKRATGRTRFAATGERYRASSGLSPSM